MPNLRITLYLYLPSCGMRLKSHLPPPSACSPFATTVTLVAASQGWLFCVITTIVWQRIELKRFKTDESQITLSRERK